MALAEVVAVAAVGAAVAAPAPAAAPRAASSLGATVVVRAGAVIVPVMAVATAWTPEMAGFFSLIGIPPLGVSSVPGKKPRQVTSSSLPPSHPSATHCNHSKGIQRQRWPEGLFFLESEPEARGWAISLHPPQHLRTVSLVTVSPGTAPARETAVSEHLPPSLGAVH